MILGMHACIHANKRSETKRNQENTRTYRDIPRRKHLLSRKKKGKRRGGEKWYSLPKNREILELRESWATCRHLGKGLAQKRSLNTKSKEKVIAENFKKKHSRPYHTVASGKGRNQCQEAKKPTLKNLAILHEACQSVLSIHTVSHHRSLV